MYCTNTRNKQLFDNIFAFHEQKVKKLRCSALISSESAGRLRFSAADDDERPMYAVPVQLWNAK